MATAPGGLCVVEWTYGPQIKVTLSEPSTSIVVRSEHQYTRDERHRFTIRKHFYELLPDALPSPNRLSGQEQFLALGCHDILPQGRFGSYLGFIDLRPKSKRSPIAMGLLVPPRWLRMDPETVIVTGEYGPLFGGSGFPCTVYSMQEPDLGGAKCAQACVIMALSALSDRGARIVGSYNVTYLAKDRKDVQDLFAEALPQECLAKRHGTIMRQYFEVKGLRLSELRRALENFECRVSPHCTDIPSEAPRRIAVRIVEAYVAARFPVIMAVDRHEWYKQERTPGKEPVGHAVVIVGARRSRLSVDDAWLVVHDPGYKPFGLRPAIDCFRAALAYDPSDGTLPSPRLRLFPVADAAIKRHLSTCLGILQKNAYYAQILRKFSGDSVLLDPSPSDAMVQPSERDVTLRLIHRDDLTDTLIAFGRFPAERTRLQMAFVKHLQPCRHWMIACFERGHIKYAWLFNAEESSKNALDIFLFERDGKPVLHNFSHSNESGGKPQSDQKQTGYIEGPKPAASSVNPLSRRRLVPSVMTSSSIKPLAQLFAEIHETTGVELFDILLLRDTDVQELEESAVLPRSNASIPKILANGTYTPGVIQWLLKQLESCTKAWIRVPAIATYFPNVTSLQDSERETAVAALTNAVHVALALQAADRMTHAIVEIVCGNILDRCECAVCNKERIFISSPENKIETLLESLKIVVDNVKRATGREDFFFALELEPGITYVLRKPDQMETVMKLLGDKYSDLDKHVGFNLDVAHMRIAEVADCELRPYSDRFLHAHTSDHPQMHTRDQTVGLWTSIECNHESGHYPLLRLLSERAAAAKKGTQLPFSGAVALELEGCGRLGWIRNSIGAMKHQLSAACLE